MASGQACRWCRESGHNIRTCETFTTEIMQIDLRVEGDVRRAADALRRYMNMKNEEIRELRAELHSARLENDELRRKLAAAQVTVEAQDAIIDAQFRAAQERENLISRLLSQLGSIFS